MTDNVREYEVAVVGGGPAGLTTALYTTRLGHDTVVVNRGGGRAAMMTETHNVIGVTEDVSGNELLGTARDQIRHYGADYVRDFVESAERTDDGRFRLSTGDGDDPDFLAERVVLATGFTDERPAPAADRQGSPLVSPLRRLHVRGRTGVRDGDRRVGRARCDDYAQLHRRGG